MLNLEKTYRLSFLLLFTVANLLNGQSNKQELPETPGEEVFFFCDRDFYVVAENIHFGAHIFVDPETGMDEWSKVLYVELIKADGSKIAQSSFAIKEGLAQGSIQIPENTRSGNYYLRAYTRWMRNYSPYSYKYLQVKIINPHIDMVDSDQNGVHAVAKGEWNQSVRNEGQFSISGLAKEYGSREDVEIQVTLNDTDFSGHFVLIVSKLFNAEKVIGNIEFQGPEDAVERIKDIEFFPNINNVLLTGSVIDKESKEPLSNRDIALASTHSPFYFNIVKSDEHGDFIFTLPDYDGNYQFCLKSLNDNEGEAEFLINSNFCNREIHLPFQAFELSPEEKDYVKQLIATAQLSQKFLVESDAGKEDEYLPFYGKAERVTKVEDFVELEDLREFFFELVLDVLVETRNEESYLKFIPRNKMSIYPPLVLLDNIPVKNGKELLSIPSKNIDRIEQINGGYLVNHTIYGGIISIYSKNNDLGGYELTGDEQFFNYQLFNFDTSNLNQKKLENNPRMPRMSNTLYFNPLVEVSQDHKININFQTGDAPGGYTLTVLGIDNTGMQIVDQLEFSVK